MTNQRSGLLCQSYLFILKNLCLLIALLDNLGVRLFLGIWKVTAVQLDELLKAAVAVQNKTSAFLDLLVFGLHLLVQMSDFGGQIRNCRVSDYESQDVGGQARWTLPSCMNCSSTAAGSSAIAIIHRCWRDLSGQNTKFTGPLPHERPRLMKL